MSCTSNCRTCPHRCRRRSHYRDHKSSPEIIDICCSRNTCQLLTLLTLLMQRPLPQVNMSSPQGCCVAQLCNVVFSSAPSTQSGSPSQIHFLGMHWARCQDLFSTHVNSVSSSHLRSSAKERERLEMRAREVAVERHEQRGEEVRKNCRVGEVRVGVGGAVGED